MSIGCERCGARDARVVGERAALCENCILRALAARFPLFGLSLDELALALRRGEGAARGRRAAGGRRAPWPG